MTVAVPQSARLFFALWPTPAMQAGLAAAADHAVSEAEKADSGVRRVPAENFHLTVAFLGSVPLSRLPEVKALTSRCSLDAPIELVLEGIEHWRKSQVLCATASETPPAAVVLAETLKRLLIEQEFSPDLKPFRAHATVARKVRRVTRELKIEPVRWSFDALHLVESRTSPAGSVYTIVR
jgi:RNA 2',3'-cyclic 3'-phosphodiesterase